ncbi:MAG: DUF2752 domain-containing protein [Actinomycetota bacterium]|nr:DUF2752 domain-containing protein [Actinomycetota bacterium]
MSTVASEIHAHACCEEPLSHWWNRSIWLNGRHLALGGAAMIAAGLAMSVLSIHTGFICPLRAATGIPCPFCGMTTSVRSSLRLDFSEAFAANPAGALAVVAAVVLILLRPRRIRIPVSLATASVAGMWLFQLNRFELF